MTKRSVEFLQVKIDDVSQIEDILMITTVEFPQEILESARLAVPEVKVELAVHLYEQNRLSIGKARELAGMHLWEFRQLLASRKILPHYDESDLASDIAVLRGFGQL